MKKSYARDEIIGLLIEYFRREGFTCERYYDKLGEIRLPLYCFKPNSGGIKEEMVIDVITESHISKEIYLPDMPVEGALIKNASSVTFFQYYLPRAKVFWAYGDYVEKDQSFTEFEKACMANGIGLLEVSEDHVNLVLDSTPLNQILRKLVQDEIDKMAISQSQKDQIVNKISELIENNQDEYLHYLVFYGHPKFRRREIIGREKEDLSMLLINELEHLKNVNYAQILREFASKYRQRTEDDYQIALGIIKTLWRSQLDIEYPDIQKDFEVVLRLDPEYRDHFLHQFQVFLLGALIIDKLYNEGWVKNFEASHGSKLEIAWLAASTYHDFNYPIQEWDGWMTNFLEQNFHAHKSSGKRHLHNPDIQNEIIGLHLGKIVVRDEFISKMGRLCTAIGCSFNDCFERFILRRVAVNKNHAVIGAFTFLEKFQKSSLLSPLAVDQAAVSILLHDEPNWQCFRGDMASLRQCNLGKECSYEEKELCKTPFLTHLTLESLPLAFLLTFCDVAQHWGRKGRGYEVEEPRLKGIEINKQEILIYISVLNDLSYDNKEKETTRLGRYLSDDRFAIRISSREGKRDTTIRMSGT